jgi:hypothetical protein
MAWSYSSLKTFTQCPKKYFHVRVAKDVKEESTEALLYGQQLHKAAEDYLKVGTPIPPKFGFVQEVVDTIKQIPGEKHCELRLGVRLVGGGYEPCDFFAKDVWWRGVGDVVVVKDELAFSIDYKTSKNAKYADLKQLDALAAALFVHFPKLKRIKSALAFVVSNEFVHKEHFAENRDEYFAGFSPDLDRLEAAEKTGVWNANAGPLCRYCPVTSCEHNRK